MGKIKKIFLTKSLKTTFTIYLTACLIIALMISLFLSNLCQMGQSLIFDKYQDEYAQYGKIVESENINGNFQYFTKDFKEILTSKDLAIYEFLGILSVVVSPVTFIACIIITSIIFYKRQFLKPFTILNDATDNIADNNLDFTITYDSTNELGKLCLSFEKMREALKDNNMEMWRQVEERKHLNAAFAHDLRTPLTVLKGQSEMLVKYAPKMPDEKIVSTAEMMMRHITRLETYVNTMNDLQRLEDIEIQKALVNVNEITTQMRITGTSICVAKELDFIEGTANVQNMKLDMSVIMQVFENLMANAVRYAKNKVTITVSTENSVFFLSVADDGMGFTDNDLLSATNPFYKTENESTHEHFGMGLNICKILCEKHGGHLNLSNSNGAKVKAVFKQ